MVLPGIGMCRAFGLSTEALAAEANSEAFAELRMLTAGRLFELARELDLVPSRMADTWRRLGLVADTSQ